MGIRLSEEHGVNPSVDHCFICGKDYAVVLFGKLKGDAEAPRSVTTGGVCDECEKAKAAGAIFLIEVDEEKTTDEKNPWRTGRLAGVKEEAIRRIITPVELVDQILEHGMAYLPIEVYEGLGLHEFGDKELEDEEERSEEG